MKIERFVALSLNPALDTTLWVDGLEREYNQVLGEQCEAAGKAVNVARVLKAFDCHCKTLILAGESNRHKYFERLDADGIDYDTVFLEGEIRENISLVLPDDKLIRLARPGFTVHSAQIEEIKARLATMITPGTLAVVAGKNPVGLNEAAFVELCTYIESLGATLAVDTSSVKEQDICAIRPWIIKPNLEELELMTGETLDTHEKIAKVFQRFHQNGVQHLLLSMGGDGVLYSGGEQSEYRILHAKVPQVHVKSTVGAGDSTLSGFLLAYHSGKTIEECVRVAASFGTASVMIDGTNPPRQQELEMVYPQVEVSQFR
ncbi:hexose kinase [Hydrogenoanaerobacterium sp.]|uniref:1-phosphofructokinase family hexose kinase n=1 Tax=Hydrogenoanaerobacterium sp. TaxID=2953763 RepID=UPI0028A23C31|nr:hexose kinase [Hydrogenoanaerobacterium sp.]